MSSSPPLPRYDRTRTYQWNYDHAPEPAAVEVPPVPGTWRFCGLPVGSPLGVAAGPLLNGRWCLYYASLGFDVVTYKTVRSLARECYPLPNLQPVACGQLQGGEERLAAVEEMRGSWAVAFGMPSQAPDVWRKDVELARKNLPRDKVLSVSVVGSVREGWTIDELADDYAQCATWAVESGADCIETNFSCPNVATCDGQLYQQPRDAARVAQRVRASIGSVPFIVKIGHLSTADEARHLVAALAGHVDGLAMTNSIATTVAAPDGTLLFDGQRRGICGQATREASLAQCRLVARIVAETNAGPEIIGVGGVFAADDVRRYLAAGASAVHLATAVMVDPGAALAIRRELADR
jgi:dihydroorotate dehydrogenase (NAD+) catalytic subunit